MHVRHPVALMSLVTALLGVSPAAAQVTFDIGPSVGLYLPLATYEGPPANDGLGFGNYTWTQSNAPTIGAAGNVWFGERFGLALSYRYSPSDVSRQSSLSQVETRYDGNLSAAALEAQLRLGDEEQTFRVLFSAGGSWITHGGPAFDDVEVPGKLGGVIGLGSEIRLTDHLILNARLRSLLYSMQVEGTPVAYPSTFQVDLLGEAAIMYRFF